MTLDASLLLEVHKRLQPDGSSGEVPWQPLPGPQSDAFTSDADELLFGGAAGGGKSDLVLGLALTVHRRSIIFRREYPQLAALIDRSKEIIGDKGRFNESKSSWRNLPGGRVIEFGAVQYDADKHKYQGRPHDLIAFDELANFLESQYLFLIGWNRTTDPHQRTRVVGASNPPTNADGEWIIRRWAPWLDPHHPQPAKPGELRWFAVIDGKDTEVDGPAPIVRDGEEIRPKSRTFIPARLADNPYLMATDYGATLQRMPEPLRSQMLYGDFSIGQDDDPWQIIPTEWVRLAQRRWSEEAPTTDDDQPLPLSGLGVDVARGGKDQTVIARRYAHWFAPLVKHPGQATPDGPAVAVIVTPLVTDGVTANVDVIGVGGAVYDALMSNGLRAHAVNVATGSQARDRTGKLGFINVRAELWWRLREALDPTTGDDLALPPDPELLADLVAPRWKLGVRGIQVEDKEDIKKRLGRSPDCGDAVVLALLTPPRVTYADNPWY